VRRIDRRTRFVFCTSSDYIERLRYSVARTGFRLRKLSVGFFTFTSAPTTLGGGGGAPSVTSIVNEPVASKKDPTATVYWPGQLKN
jgi:hypothetical protein